MPVPNQALEQRFDEQLENLFDASSLPKKLAVAVSGGSDSMALTLLLKGWCQNRSIQLVAFTVDHGLRAEAASEALLVQKWMVARHIDHHILTGSEEPPAAGLQEYARELRYGLLSNACQLREIEHLFVGHQMEDQQETFLMRFSKGSGLNGLAGMSTQRHGYGVQLIRPLLSFQRHELREYLNNLSQDWVEDPSNENAAFTRTEVGKIQKSLTRLHGVTINSLQLSLNRLNRSNDALEHYTVQLWVQIAEISEFGFVSLNLPQLMKEPDETIIRIFEKAIQTIRGVGYRSKLSDLERLVTRFQTDSPADEDFTVAGCRFRQLNANVNIYRERGRHALETRILESGNQWLWDQRFQVQTSKLKPIPLTAATFEIREIGNAGWSQIKDLEIRPEILKLPVFVRNSLPVVFKGQKVVAAPLFFAETQQSAIAREQFEMLFIPLR